MDFKSKYYVMFLLKAVPYGIFVILCVILAIPYLFMSGELAETFNMLGESIKDLSYKSFNENFKKD